MNDELVAHYDLDQLEQAADQKADIYEEAVSMGQKIARGGDHFRILIGGLALLVERRYNEGNINKFADDCGVGVKALRSYANVVAVFERATAVELLDEFPTIHWVHLRAAARLRDRDAAIALVKEAASEGWTGSMTETKVSKTPSAWHPLVSLERAKLTSIDYQQGTATFEIGDALNSLLERVGQLLKLDIKVRGEVQG